ncbi:DoxX family protein [Streptomyces sp. TS71-3]|uniref:DoxX family protein n=1 Tax=Streptomyces sp. TS71-3 TaxID=2733862 RepID=UPI001B0C23ED|nr:DoxX family protein [Streptomyces sp. TS71-3]GHJ37234.1 hypothetical protein Sm713_28430 [Streptomyces sp. TS71-3]
MNLALWIIACVLAAVFLAAGLMKMVQPKEKLVASGMGWAESFSPGGVKALGAVEVLGAVGVILPAAVGVADVLVAWAAVGMAITMLGATVVHARRKEAQSLPITVVLLILAVVVAWGRFGPYSF